MTGRTSAAGIRSRSPSRITSFPVSLSLQSIKGIALYRLSGMHAIHGCSLVSSVRTLFCTGNYRRRCKFVGGHEVVRPESPLATAAQQQKLGKICARHSPWLPKYHRRGGHANMPQPPSRNPLLHVVIACTYACLLITDAGGTQRAVLAYDVNKVIKRGYNNETLRRHRH